MKYCIKNLIILLLLIPIDSIADQLTSYPEIILNIMNKVPRWVPSVEVTSSCLASLKNPVLKPDLCRISKKLNFFDSFRSKLFFDFDAEGEIGFKKIDIDLTPSVKARGLLGLQANEKRPLVIFRMGIHGNRDEFMAERYLIKILYQELGYHVLMLESLTSHGNILASKNISFGGLEEGLQTFYILNLINNNEFSWTSQVTDIHLVALSMGGEGAFLTTYLDEQTIKKIKSIEVLCPLINLETTFKNHFKPGLTNAVGDIWNSLRLKALTEKTMVLQELSMWKMLIDLKPRYSPLVLDYLNQTVKKPLLSLSDFENRFKHLKWPLEFVNHMQKDQSYLERNNFWPFFKNEKTPIQFILTPHDVMAINELNSDLIRKHQQPGTFNKVKFMDLDGFHCSLAQEYQWPFLVEIVRRGLENTNP